MNRLVPYSGEVYAYLVTGYGTAFWAIEIATCLAIAVLLFAGAAANGAACRTAAAGLGILWIWVGGGFYWQTYQPLNWAGFHFGWAVLIQAALIGGWGVKTGAFRPVLQIDTPRDRLASSVGLLALGVAALTGPLLHIFSGEAVVAIQAIGGTPLATILATLALLLLNRTRPPFWLLPLPVLLLVWEVIRTLVLDIWQDGILLTAAGGVLAFLVAGWFGNRAP